MKTDGYKPGYLKTGRVQMLTNATLAAAKPQQKPYKLTDERGLYLLVNPNGSRLWRLRFTLAGKENVIALGAFPDVTLKRAREKRDEARAVIADGKNPAAERAAQKAAQADTFEGVAREWHIKQSAKWDAGHAVTVLRRMEAGLFPWIGDKPVSVIEPPELLETLRRTEGRGAIETAHRLLQHASKVFRYAIATGRANRDPAADVRGALEPIVWKPRAAILIPARVGELLRATDAYQGQPATMAALKLAPLVFVRPGELRAAEWAEFDLHAAEWRIPAATRSGSCVCRRSARSPAYVVPRSIRWRRNGAFPAESRSARDRWDGSKAKFRAGCDNESKPGGHAHHDGMMVVTMTTPDRIEIDPSIARGQAVIRGTRIPVTLVVGSLAGGMSCEEVQREYDLALEDIQAALEYVVEIAGDRKKWREENREAIEAYNEYVERHGVFSDDVRRF